MLKMNQLIGFSSGGDEPVTPGNVSFTNPGSDTFVVEPYNTLTITLWGGGAGGVGTQHLTYVSGGNGTPSSWDGGVAAGKPQANGGITGVTTSGGAGGSATGGDTNTSGGTASRAGGSSPNGGTGGAASVQNGNGGAGGEPGAGGGGGWYSAYRSGSYPGAGGGAGAYCQKTYAKGEYPVGTEVSIQVGSGGNGGSALRAGGAGAKGKVIVSWQ